MSKSLDPRQKNWLLNKNWPTQKILVPRKKFWPTRKIDPRNNNFDPRNPRKN